MFVEAYLLGIAVAVVTHTYREGQARGEGQSCKAQDRVVAEAMVLGLLWLPALFFFWPYVFGRRRGAALKDARVRAALVEQEVAKLEEDARHEVALALVRGGDGV